MSDIQIINESINNFYKPGEKDIERDISKAQKYSKSTNKLFNTILSKYKKIQSSQIPWRNYIFDICNILKDINQDFIFLLKIYNLLNDPYIKQVLITHFVVKSKNNGININEYDIKKLPIKISISYINNNQLYYNEFIQGMLLNFKYLFENAYLTQYIPSNYYTKPFIYYKNNNNDFCKCLQKIISDFERLIKCDKSSKLSENNKMDISTYDKLIKRSKINKDTILSALYNKCESDEILYYEIKKLKLNKYFELECYLEDYINSKKNEELKAEIKELKAKNDSDIRELNSKIDSKDSEIKELNAKMDSKDSEIKKMNNSINSIEKKVNFMEIVVKSSLSRKIINHCIIGVVKKYANSIKITIKDNETFNISFEKPVKNVSLKEANNLLNYLFSKKDKCNGFVHFEGIEKPNFIDDVWNEFFAFIELKDNNLMNFNKIVTDDIKKTFKFAQKDQSISSFLKTFKKD